MPVTPLSTNSICQVAIVVRDIERSAQAWAKLLGVAMPNISITDTADKSHAMYRGAPTSARAKLAFFSMGQVRLELIEPVGEPSTWKEFLDKRGEGVHHIAFQVTDTEQEAQTLKAHGMALAQTGDFTGGRYAYVDGEAQIGVTLELLQNT